MKALFPGSFDPPHLGHIDALRRAAIMADDLVVGVAVNPAKQPLLPVEVRVALLQALLADLPHVRVVAYVGATAHFARKENVAVLLRGIRLGQEFENERAMTEVHRGLGLVTMFVPTAPALMHISSSAVRLTLAAGLPLDGLVPPSVAAALGAITLPTS